MTPLQLDTLEGYLRELADLLKEIGAPRSIQYRASDAIKAVDYVRTKK